MTTAVSRSRPVRPTTIPVAEVGQDVQTIACNDREVVSAFDFDPAVESIQSLAP